MNDYKNEIASCCRKLRLSANLAGHAMNEQGESNQEYLFRLMEAEIVYRREVRINKLLNTAGFPKRYRFDQFDAREVQFPADTNVATLKNLDFYEERKNIIMYGGTGTGKTMLSICIGLEACQREIPVKFFRTASLVNQLSENKAAGGLSRFIKKLSKASILILDEFGYVPYDRTGSQLLFDYLSEIHEHKCVILNTNLEFSRWVNILYDEQMTAALVGRLMHHCQLLLFPGKNNRLRESSMNEVYAATEDRFPKEEPENDDRSSIN